MKKLVTQVRMITLSMLLSGLTVFAAGAADTKPTLGNADCVKCHAKAPEAIAANGGAHKTEIGCQDCHVGHPPTVKKIIPQCSQCHTGKPHYSLTACLRCHTNPHTPKKITLTNNITDECVTCHTLQIAKLKQVKSKHSALACSFCHSTHGKIPLCTQCHKPHSSEMAASDCKKCHQAHLPTVVTYNSDTANRMCAACHGKAFDLHSKTDTKHKNVTCVTCHKEKHKTIPTCQSCHGAKHPSRIMERFPKCSQCHNIAHDLNRWEVAPVTRVDVKKAPVKDPKKK